MYFCSGEMAEWSNAAVLKTVEGNTSGGSNPSFSAEMHRRKTQSPVNHHLTGLFCFYLSWFLPPFLCISIGLTIGLYFYKKSPMRRLEFLFIAPFSSLINHLKKG